MPLLGAKSLSKAIYGVALSLRTQMLLEWTWSCSGLGVTPSL
ncbi:MAG TPA: hypothetical protein VNT79_12935 [Phycisphaerae bacterium]|nr:hypothetical protein [Phycisphaerae bacterium]